MNWIGLFISVTLSLLLLNGIIWSFYLTHLVDEIKEVKCYDKYSNEIKGQICIERNNSIPFNFVLFASIIGSVITIIFLFFIWRHDNEVFG